MKTNTFAIVVGTGACNAACPFCISKMTMTPTCQQPVINRRRFDIACRIVDQMRDGLVTVMLTGQGEPLLWPTQIDEYLERLGDRFPLIEMQTNGVLVKQNLDNFRRWRDNGLSLVCLSVADRYPTASNQIMGIDANYDYWETAQMLMGMGLSVRINCTMVKGGVDNVVLAGGMIRDTHDRGIDKLTFREVERPVKGVNDKVSRWVDEHKPEGLAKQLRQYLLLNGATEILRLPPRGVVYDDQGQNVAILNCLEGTTDPDNLRLAIFFPDGRIGYDWRYPGARIL